MGDVVIVLDNGVARTSGRVVNAQQGPVAQAVVVLQGCPTEILAPGE